VASVEHVIIAGRESVQVCCWHSAISSIGYAESMELESNSKVIKFGHTVFDEASVGGGSVGSPQLTARGVHVSTKDELTFEVSALHARVGPFAAWVDILESN